MSTAKSKFSPQEKSKFSPKDSTGGQASRFDRWSSASLRSLNLSERGSSTDSFVRSLSSELVNSPSEPVSPSIPECSQLILPSKKTPSVEAPVRNKSQGNLHLPSPPFRLTGGLAVYLVLALSLSLNSLWLLSSALLSPVLRHNKPLTRWRNSLSGSYHFASDPLGSERFIPESEHDKLVLGSTECSSGALVELRSYLQDVVLTFFFKEDSAARESSQLLKSIYGRFFKAVVVFGPHAVPDLGIEGRVGHHWGNLSGSGLEESLRASTSSNVGPWSFTSGSFSYLSFPKVVAMHPDAEGYLWLEDGAILNYWQLIRANKSKLWLTDMPECLRCQGFIPFDHRIHPTVYDGWAGHPEVRKRARSAFSSLPDKFKRQFMRSLQDQVNITSFPKRIIDSFYVPKRLSFQLAFDIIPLFREYGVVPEIALPTMFYALESPDQFDNSLQRSDHRMELPGLKYDPAALWTPYVTVFYHWHLLTQNAKDKLVRAFSVSDSCLLQLLPKANSTKD